MPYGNSKGMDKEVNKLKNKIAEQRPDLNVDNLSTSDMKNMLVNEINKNTNIDNSVKEKINKGDIDGLKSDIIDYLSKNKSSDGSTDKLVNMLKSNDMEGLKNQLMGMLLGGMGQQKKNEVEGDEAGNNNTPAFGNLLGGLDYNTLINGFMNKYAEGKKDDARVNLLKSMRPFVTETRQKSIDDAIKILGMMGFFESFTGKAGK